MKSSLYTRTGDNGTTALVGGTRASKTSARIEAYGTVDELNSWLGLLASHQGLPGDDIKLLQWIQSRLFDIGSYLACPAPDPGEAPMLPPGVTTDDITLLEQAIDRLDADTPKVHRFILPGGSPAAATAQVARTVARRAERRILTLHAEETVDPAPLHFINRLSDYLFILGRQINHLAGIAEPLWEHPSKKLT